MARRFTRRVPFTGEQTSWSVSDGFFLQVEGASIDKRDHAANPCQQIGETIAFDKAIGAALDWQRSHPDTLILVTADHGHTSQIVAEDSNGTNGPTGYAEDLLTKDGQKLRISYGTAGGLTRPSAPAARRSPRKDGDAANVDRVCTFAPPSPRCWRASRS